MDIQKEYKYNAQATCLALLKYNELIAKSVPILLAFINALYTYRAKFIYDFF